ncbi:F-box protein GID2-like [Cucurbita pepo subsp. pepo]|uniref:F-box protein GID2-like n=1 Tax=Cucurbita pepo subsp. pepo TaxID=3664 RepID=UPI000C9D2A0C|nr:F-box protein GID2-like [Cucurbita pepo subsp. pepo]XP_023547045.1 F-box protein GID2-like [Cucurbita pepo subsp. pepo]
MKKIKSVSQEQQSPPPSSSSAFANLDDNLLFEVFKHVDARTLATAAGVSKQWYKTAHDEWLWELLCTKHWANIGCANQQLRSVVLALGGFRRLHSLYPFPPVIGSASCIPWGKDEVHLSLSLLSIRYYEKMKFKNRPTS